MCLRLSSVPRSCKLRAAGDQGESARRCPQNPEGRVPCRGRLRADDKCWVPRQAALAPRTLLGQRGTHHGFPDPVAVAGGEGGMHSGDTGHGPHSPVLHHDLGPERVQQLLPVALGLEVHQLGLEAHAGGKGQGCHMQMCYAGPSLLGCGSPCGPSEVAQESRGSHPPQDSSFHPEQTRGKHVGGVTRWGLAASDPSWKAQSPRCRGEPLCDAIPRSGMPADTLPCLTAPRTPSCLKLLPAAWPPGHQGHWL